MGAGFTGKVSAKHSRFLKKVIYKVISYKEFLKNEICFKFSFMSNAVDQRSGIVHLERMQIFRKITIFYPNTHTFICILYFIYRLIWNSWTVLGNDSFLMKFQSFTHRYQGQECYYIQSFLRTCHERVEFICQPAFTCSKSTIKTLEQGVKYIQS